MMDELEHESTAPDWEVVDVKEAGIDNEYPHGKPPLIEEGVCTICGESHGAVGLEINWNVEDDVVPEDLR